MKAGSSDSTDEATAHRHERAPDRGMNVWLSLAAVNSMLSKAVVDAAVDEWVPLRDIDVMALDDEPGATLDQRKAVVLQVLAELMEAGLVVLW